MLPIAIRAISSIILFMNTFSLYTQSDAVTEAVARLLARRAFATATPTGRVTEWTQTIHDGPRSWVDRFARVELRVQYKPRGRYSVTYVDLPLH